MNVFIKLLLTSFILLVSSCGKGNLSKKKDDTVVGSFEKLKLEENRALNSTELVYADKICDALEFNRNFLYRSIGEDFRFSFMRDYRSCSAPVRPLLTHDVKFASPLDFDAPLNYTSANGLGAEGFKYDIFTDQNLIIKDLCERRNLNLIQNISNVYVKFRFYSSSTFEYFVYTKSADEFVSTRFESIQVDMSTSSKRYGMVSTRISGGYCTNGSQTYYVQTMK